MSDALHDGELASDREPAHIGYGTGGVPWLLLLFYLGFLVFFVWYVLEYQLPDFLQQGPIRPGAAQDGGAGAG